MVMEREVLTRGPSETTPPSTSHQPELLQYQADPNTERCRKLDRTAPQEEEPQTKHSLPVTHLSIYLFIIQFISLNIPFLFFFISSFLNSAFITKYKEWKQANFPNIAKSLYTQKRWFFRQFDKVKI